MDLEKKAAEMEANAADPTIVEDAQSVAEEVEGGGVSLATDPDEPADKGFVPQSQVELEG